MTIDCKIRDKKLQFYINRETVKNQHCHPEKLINILLHMKKYCPLIESSNRTS